ATTNAGKVREIRAALRGLPLAIVGLAEALPGVVYRERGRTFIENARGKGRFYSRRTGLLTLAEDSGLEVQALDGQPGVRSARFAGPRASDAANNRKLLKLLAATPRTKRRARFVCTMVLARDGRIIKEIRGEARGVIAPAPRGEGGFGYDPLFYAPRLRKTFAELAPAVKNEVSHRGRALRKLEAFLRRELGRV
ncbi:MAG: RdgB/HAM1 family non-canonical purine NTP pyrophosphatase, partial [Candidatus Aminicenantes bacterium]|nr:RdgB/HAM1 family non-canonical purine NTP pyrophosphatase [Candidatus Aminicenantes bacterium]